MIGRNKRIKRARRQSRANIVAAVTTKMKIELKKLEKILLNISATA